MIWLHVFCIVILKQLVFVHSDTVYDIPWIENFIPEDDTGHALTYSEEYSRRAFNNSVLSTWSPTYKPNAIGTEIPTTGTVTTKPILRNKVQKKVIQKKPVPRSRQKNVQMSTRTLMDLKGNDNKKPSKKFEELYKYLRPYTIKETMEVLAAEHKHVNITVEVVGKTAEYRDIVLMTMTRPDDDEPEPKPNRFRIQDDRFIDEEDEKKVIFIVHGLSSTNGLPFLQEKDYFQQLLTKYVSHLDKFNIFLMPMANPDAVLTAANKNMSPQGSCSGVALDRNFDVAWGSHKNVSSCSEFYPGPAPFSEPETRAVRDILQRYNHKIVSFIHIHSNNIGLKTDQIVQGDAILYPKGYTETNSDDDRYIDLKGEVEEAMKSANFQTLTVEVQTLYEWYGLVYGTSIDYAASIFGIPFSFEFAVQPMPTYDLVQTHLEFVWGKMIDVVFNYVYKNIKNGDDKK